MQFVCYDDLETGQSQVLGIELFGVVYDLAQTVSCVGQLAGLATPPVPDSLWAYHAFSPEQKTQLAAIVGKLPYIDLEDKQRCKLVRHDIRRLAPVPHPTSLRCFSSFEAHARSLRQRRGLSMPAEWFKTPVFYFGNVNAVFGPGEEIPQPASFWLDFELQIACVIGKQGINIRAADADEYILGYTIMNDWCARDLEMHEMALGCSPAKGRDFAISLGPTLVTPDELVAHAIGNGAQRRYDLQMEVSVNEHPLAGSGGNFKDIHFTFAQMIEHASSDAMLVPGDVIASGAVGGGSLLDVGAEETLGRWLQPGDVVEFEVEVLGALRNTIVLPRS